ncbi:hypothetical protein MPL3356_60519 [Mesorhizobium plurifarium]|uniref:Uncharacterized protein n=1 Tax=Mesorhizobium plurifarium TaxID=69974 RepID=A0A090E9W1_MESPL|nr:hypothetical protein MPL3356_60519 [Mesorhizobium plurifarium]
MTDKVIFFSCRHCGGVKEQRTREVDGFHIVTYLAQIIPTERSCYHRSWDDERGWNFVEVQAEKVDG